ncbi:MAG: hypothetical protein AB7J13_14710 [Pyrinomonadaceae bacterium]
MQSKAWALRDAKTYRSTSISEELVAGTIQNDKTRREMTEMLLPSRSRYLSISTIDGKNKTREVVRIGSIYWVRVNNGRWEKNPAPESRGLHYVPKPISRTHRIVGISGSQGHFLTLYEEVTYQTSNETAGMTRAQVATVRYWIDKSGLIHQQLYEVYDVDSNTINRRHIFYQYEPKDIKIVAPVIK